MGLQNIQEKEYTETPLGHKSASIPANPAKLWILAILFFTIFIHLYIVVAHPQIEIISDRILISMTLALVLYLWIQELRDRYRLQMVNQAYIENQQELELTQVDTIATLILTEEAKDPFMRGHSEAVARYALAIAQEMGFGKDRLTTVERAGILHDIGKLGMANELVRKPDKLNEKEWEVMRNHPRRGAEIIKPLDFLSKEQEVILRHHEHYDGTGYPDGLRGEEIPLESRIIAVADAFVAMNSERPYRQVLSHNDVVAELQKSAGKQFDHSVVKALLSLLEKNPKLWEKS